MTIMRDGMSLLNVEQFSKNLIDPISKFRAEKYPFRTACYKMDRVWHVLEVNLKMDPRWTSVTMYWTSVARSLIFEGRAEDTCRSQNN